MLDGDAGRVFVLDADPDEPATRRRVPEPLVLRVVTGDCIEVRLTNRLDDSPVSFHADLLAYDPTTSGGVAAGNNPRQAVDPGETGAFELYADPDLGEVTSLVRDMADPEHNAARGLYGAIIVAPKGTRFTDPT